MSKHVYFCIDLKSFYASVECVERGLDPLTTDLVVADPDRSEKTICLAVSPSLRAKGIKNRCRVFEIPENIDYITATPRMQKYIDYSADIYGVYLKYFSVDDIFVYSIDEVFIDITPYLSLYKMNPKELAQFIMDEVRKETGIIATCGIGTNLYLAKIALDITAKHSSDFIGILNIKEFRRTLWDHIPLSDFWRIGKKTEKRLNEIGIKTMRDITLCNEETLYNIFGINAELLIDHAWGLEPVTIEDIKNYTPKSESLGSGQVLMRDYHWREAEIIVKEMAEQLSLELLNENMITKSLSLTIEYSRGFDQKASNGTTSFEVPTNSDIVIVSQLVSLYEKIVNRDVPIRKITITFNNTAKDEGIRQLSLFEKQEDHNYDKNKKLRSAVLNLKHKFGENSVLKGLDLERSATMIERNTQIGGHRSGN